MTYTRSIQGQIEDWLFKKKTIILYGARQTGKTTLCQQILAKYPKEGKYYLCEQPIVSEILSSKNIDQIVSFFENSKLVVLDEAQKVRDIGQVLKLLHDTKPAIQIIATGSSSFDLANRVTEPLTGRNIKFNLYPLSLDEISQQIDLVSISNRLSDYLRFGMYPGIIDQTETAKKRLLDELGSDYLFKDVLSTETLRKPDFLRQLLKALALQIGSEVSFRELSNLLGTSVETIQRYVQLLEHSFVIFRLSSYSRNLRSEIGRGNKFFFYDLGIRNSLLQNYSPLEGRTDAGALWENFCIVERMKLIQYEQKNVNLYFWRTKTQKEIDFIEESDGKLAAFEFKLKPGEAKAPKDFSDAYPYTTFNTIHPKNFFQFLRRSTTSPLPE